MGPVRSLLEDAAQARRISEECVALVERQVASLAGLAGFTVRSALAVLQKIRPGMLNSVVDWLLPEMAEAADVVLNSRTDPSSSNVHEPLAAWLAVQPQRTQLVNGLLAVADRRVERTSFRAVKVAYGSLRPQAAKYVDAAIPDLAVLIARHVTQTSR